WRGRSAEEQSTRAAWILFRRRYRSGESKSLRRLLLRLPVGECCERRRMREQDGFDAATLAIALVPVPPYVGVRVGVAVEADADAPRPRRRDIAEVMSLLVVPYRDRVSVDWIGWLLDELDVVSRVEARKPKRRGAKRHDSDLEDQ